MTSLTQLTVEHADDLKRGRTTAVSSGGWCVKISGPNVIVPVQDSAGKSMDDLATLLQAAYQMAGTRINSESDRGPACVTRCLNGWSTTSLRSYAPPSAPPTPIGIGRRATSIAAWGWRGATLTCACHTHFWSQPCARACRPKPPCAISTAPRTCTPFTPSLMQRSPLCNRARQQHTSPDLRVLGVAGMPSPRRRPRPAPVTR